MATISFTGLASGMDTASWVDALVQIKQQSVTSLNSKKSEVQSSSNALSTVQSTFNNLRSSIEKITDSKFGSTFDIFAKNSATSSNSSVVDAVVSADAVRQNLEIVVSKLASKTVASGSSSETVLNGGTNFSTLANGSAKTGSFSVYVDGNKYYVDVTDESTIDSILTDISDKTGLSATLQDGKISISSATGQDIVLGSTSDSSNFVNIMSMIKNDDGSYSSYKAVSKVNTSATLMSADSGFDTAIQAGSFKIGNATFEIDDTTTLQGLIAEINSSEDAGVTAYWDSAASKMVLTSKTDGAFNINVENISGNFTDVIGFTESTYDADGKVVSSKLKSGTQALGDYAELTVNGTHIISTSNTVGSEISGLQGVTLNLKDVTPEDEKNTVIKIENDTTELKTALKSMIEAFNKTISNVDTAVSSDGALYGESTLTSIRNLLRTSATSTASGTGDYSLLSSIGITTGQVGSTVNDDTDKLVFDEEKFDEAFSKNPEAVKALLIGEDKNSGVLTKMETIVENATASTTGYFATRSSSFSKEISNLTTSINNAQSKVDAYKAQLEAQFAAMEQLISSMNTQYSNFTVGA